MKIHHLHRSIPSQRAEAGVVVLHPWWGLNDDVMALADRLASEAGFVAVAPDLYDGKQPATTIEGAEALQQAQNEDAADALALAAVDALGEAIGDPSARMATIGFSMGAAWAMWLPSLRPEITATVVYYGSMSGPSLTRARGPVLGHFAETDEYEAEENVSEFERTLRLAGREVEIFRYPGTGHWFAEPSHDAYDAAAADLAFERTVAFLRRHLLDAG
ncbi:MAG TPA: dienelactone hydrolase family protein [Candidatus Limnocylindrales bacterium]|nr:dienelactone hydrolase family protein [Candidatus Limnocylindrales bacterium]